MTIIKDCNDNGGFLWSDFENRVLYCEFLDKPMKNYDCSYNEKAHSYICQTIRYVGE